MRSRWMLTQSWLAVCVILLANHPAAIAAAEPSTAQQVVRIWPGQPPGTADWSGSEQVRTIPVPGGVRTMQVISDVRDPTLTVFKPAPGKTTGAGMIVMPGGAFMALAWDREGTEVAQWLADHGITAFVLKYRVNDLDPKSLAISIPAGLAPQAVEEARFDGLMKALEPRYQIAVDDALQSIRFVRSNASRFGVSPKQIGLMGFSAGAIATMGVLFEADASARPDFAASIYGAMDYANAPKESPPLFIAAAEDDSTVPVEKSLDIFDAWQKAGLAAELNIYPTGGHGFGLGMPQTASAAWPQAFEAWLRYLGLTTARPITSAR